ncbi:hypothetical protein LOK49_LG09G00448 [Camellia lanceoleosa]|uniref:Uncharacterized protein n=1 Tax=Camellia lanceoleosa TaxID=1840588 RepID=A0ACC0GKP9_9ERIC|nr:hypothetical protein LOK49_LG09G00448 [Camellia lanceoleosa]
MLMICRMILRIGLIRLREAGLKIGLIRFAKPGIFEKQTLMIMQNNLTRLMRKEEEWCEQTSAPAVFNRLRWPWMPLF